MLREKNTIEGRDWSRINMRQIKNLIGAEFIHNLYNRHNTRINSIRFRNTIIEWKDGVLNSYAPEEEWLFLKKWLGNRYFDLDPELINETRMLLREDRRYFRKLFKRYQKVDFSSVSDAELANYLIDLQDKVIGELYDVNFVQIEYSITEALRRALLQIVSPNDVQEVLSTIIVADRLTEFQVENLDFERIFIKYKKSKNLQLVDNSKLHNDLIKHHDKYAYTHCAYGEEPKSMEDYVKDLNTFEQVSHIKKDLNNKIRNKKKYLKKIKSKKVTILADLLSKGGTFRDHNKANLGKMQKYRFAILDEIARRGYEDRDSINYYLLSEILELIVSHKKLNKEKIDERKNCGVILIREEGLQVSDGKEINKRTLQLSDSESMLGQCASPGIVEGVCKIIYSKKDVVKMDEGNIMVAIGTDFDLMDAIYRSSAVITEEGGLLSHASVVCREMNKPCCIGVKDVTKRLKDGDYVRVDAGKGIVAVLKDKDN